MNQLQILNLSLLIHHFYQLHLTIMIGADLKLLDLLDQNIVHFAIVGIKPTPVRLRGCNLVSGSVSPVEMNGVNR